MSCEALLFDHKSEFTVITVTTLSDEVSLMTFILMFGVVIRMLRKGQISIYYLFIIYAVVVTEPYTKSMTIVQNVKKVVYRTTLTSRVSNQHVRTK